MAMPTSRMNWSCSGRPTKELINVVCSAKPTMKNSAAIGSMVTSGSRPSARKSRKATYIAATANSPWAKLTTRTTPKITDSPSAINP